MIDWAIIGIYLIGMILIGLVSGKKVKSVKDFALSHRNYDTFFIIATMSATLIGGGTAFGIAGKTFSEGLFFVLVISGAALNQIIVSYTIAPRIFRYEGIISVGGILHHHYGRVGQIVAGLATTLISLAFTATQVSAIGLVFAFFLDIPTLYGILLGCGIVIFYASLGGMRSVIATDFFQFAILLIAIPMICNVGLNQIGGFDTLFANTTLDSLNFFPPLEQLPEHISTFTVFLLVGAFYPSFIQRLLVSRDAKQAVQSSRINGIISIPFYAILGLIGLIAFHLNPELRPDDALPYLANTLLPVGLRGIVIAGILSIIMSSADSELNIASISLIEDVLKPLGFLENTQSLPLVRFASIALGTLSILLAVSFQSIIDIMLYAFNFWGPTLLVPLVVGFFGYRVSVKYFLVSVALGISTVLIWNIGLDKPFGIDGLIPGILANILTFCLYRILNKKMLKGTHNV